MPLPPFLRLAMRSAMPLSPDLPSWSRTETILSALPPTVARVAKPPARVAACAARSAMLVLPLAMLLPRSSIFCAAMDAAVSRRPGELVGEFAGGAGGLVDDGDELAAYFGGGVEQWGFELLAESSDGGFDVADHAVEAFAAFLAAPPMCSFMAASKSAKLTLPRRRPCRWPLRWWCGNDRQDTAGRGCRSP